MLVAEAVIYPETPLLAAAAKRGCRVHPGEAMLVAQIELMVDFMLG
jgi:shikimate dehydrogenase